MYDRILLLPELVKRRSLFLFGPRQTGKSTLLRRTFPEARYVDLLEANTFRELSAYPETLRQSVKPAEKLIIIDEIQKLPALLDEVQAMIDRNAELRFVLTGSSARKLNADTRTCWPAAHGFHAYILWCHPRSPIRHWTDV